MILEYIWIDGNQEFRSKIKIINNINNFDIQSIINNSEYYWNFDGSSTNQSTTEKSDLLLKPVFTCTNPFYNNSYIVLCDVWLDDTTPHSTNTHIKIKKYYDDLLVNNNEPWFGIEQEYFIMKYNEQTNDSWNTPYGWVGDKNHNKVAPYGDIQGPYYCSVGSKNNLGREIAEEHMLKCIDAGIKICGINAEVAPSQWEFQIGICTHKEIGHHLWMARYILERVAEKYRCWINYHPKPLINFNGSGCHTNFSTKQMRENNGIIYINDAIVKLSNKHKEHIEVYGIDNHMRLTGIHETSSIENFSMGNCNRGSSIRIPINVVKDKKGYFEDRRPAANMDPYLVCSKLIETIIL